MLRHSTLDLNMEKHTIAHGTLISNNTNRVVPEEPEVPPRRTFWCKICRIKMVNAISVLHHLRGRQHKKVQSRILHEQEIQIQIQTSKKRKLSQQLASSGQGGAKMSRNVPGLMDVNVPKQGQKTKNKTGNNSGPNVSIERQPVINRPVGFNRGLPPIFPVDSNLVCQDKIDKIPFGSKGRPPIFPVDPNLVCEECDIVFENLLQCVHHLKYTQHKNLPGNHKPPMHHHVPPLQRDNHYKSNKESKGEAKGLYSVWEAKNLANKNAANISSSQSTPGKVLSQGKNKPNSINGSKGEVKNLAHNNAANISSSCPTQGKESTPGKHKSNSSRGSKEEVKDLAQSNAANIFSSPCRCDVCNIILHSPQMAKEHYEGKKHKKRIELKTNGSKPTPLMGNSIPPGKVPVPQRNMPVPKGILKVPRDNVPVPQGDMPGPRGNVPVPRGKMPAPRSNIPDTQGDMPGPRGNVPVPRGNMPVPRNNIPGPQGDMPGPRGSMPGPRGNMPGPHGNMPISQENEPDPSRNTPVPQGSSRGNTSVPPGSNSKELMEIESEKPVPQELITCHDCDVKIKNQMEAKQHFEGKRHAATLAQKEKSHRDDIMSRWMNSGVGKAQDNKYKKINTRKPLNVYPSLMGNNSGNSRLGGNSYGMSNAHYSTQSSYQHQHNNYPSSNQYSGINNSNQYSGSDYVWKPR